MQQGNPSFLAERAAKFEEIAAKQRERIAAKPRVVIKIVLPNGTEKEGVSYDTTPMDIAKVRARAAKRVDLRATHKIIGIAL